MKTEPRPWLQSYPPEVPDNIDPHPFACLPDMIDFCAERYNDRPAFINMFGTMSFTQVHKEAEIFASFLQHEWGLKKGDKLAVMMPNLLQYPVAVFGALKAGLVVVNINPLYTPRELALQLQDSGATAIVVIANFAFNLQKIIASTQIKHIAITNVGDSFGFVRGHLVNFFVRFVQKMVPKFFLPGAISFREALRRGAQRPPVPVMMQPQDIAYLQYTGGTTGQAKGAMLSHGNIMANVEQALGMYGNIIKRGEEKVLTALPLYHIFAHTINLMLFFAIGASNVLITDPRNFKAFAADLKRHRDISVLTGVNTLFNGLLNKNIFKDIKFSQLRLVIGGGAAVQSGVEERFFKETGLHILEGYGLTECSPLCCVNPPTAKNFTGSIGIPVPSTLARIVTPDGEITWDLNTPGELEFKGPQVMAGYYNRPKETAHVMTEDGYVRTGDIAVWIEGGYLKIIDRLKDMILVSGFNVFPSEIEDVVSRFERVSECAVIGVPSAKTGEAIKLYAVRRDPDLTEDELRTYCRGYLTPYKIPRYIEFVDALPKSAIGKVLRRCLRQQHQNSDNS